MGIGGVSLRSERGVNRGWGWEGNCGWRGEETDGGFAWRME
jgi:hypothetical protein